MRRVVSLAAALVLAASAATALADELVLKSGRTLAGRIVKEDDGNVTIQLRGGNMVIARGQIESIKRCPPPPDLDAPPPAPSSPPEKKGGEGDGRPAAPTGRKPDAGGSKAPKSGAKKPDPADRIAKARTLLAELETIRLVPWADQDTTPATEPNLKNYKVIRPDGTSSFREDRPASPDPTIAELYVLIDSNDGQHVFFVNGVKQVYWRRLFWHEDQKLWFVNSPELELFQHDGALADRIGRECCIDLNGQVAAAIAENSKASARWLTTPPSDEKLRADLLAACVEAMGSEHGGEILAKVHEANLAIGRSKLKNEKIQFAMERRALLRQLVDAALPAK